MRARPFAQVDVFGARPGLGNPVAVVLDGEGLDDDAMGAFARWTNLSETTFVLPPTTPEADYRVRIFTPTSELAFAGHPTLGTCHAWLGAGRAPGGDEVVQESAAGPVRVRRAGVDTLAFAAPPSSAVEPAPAVLASVLAALGLAADDVSGARVLDNGTDWLALEVRDAATVLALEPDHGALRALPKVGVVGAHPSGSHEAMEVRAFAASAGIEEDPVTGSFQASLAQWLIAEGRLPDRYVAAQGTRLGRAGRVHIDRVGEDVWVGGRVHTLVDGTATL